MPSNDALARLAAFRDDAGWPDTVLIATDREAYEAMVTGKTVWSCFYGTEAGEMEAEDGSPAFTTLESDDIDTLLEPGESGWAPYRVED